MCITSQMIMFPIMKLINFYGNARINWMSHHVTLRFTLPHINSVLFESWEDLKLSYTTITQKYFKKTHLLPLYPPDICTNNWACLAGNQQLNREKADEIVHIAKSIIVPIDMEEVSTTDPMVILRENGKGRFTRNLLIRAAVYSTMRTCTVLTLHQIKTFDRDMNIRRMICITNTQGEYDRFRINPDSSTGI